MLTKPNKEQLRQFAILLQIKRNKISKKHSRVLKLIYNHILQEVISIYKLNNKIDFRAIISKYKPEIVIVLKSVYRDSYNTFGKTLRNSIKKDDLKKSYTMLYETKATNLDNLFFLSMMDQFNKYADTHSDFIIETMIKNFIEYDSVAKKNILSQLIDKFKQLSEFERIIALKVGINEVLRDKIESLRDDITDLNQNITERTADDLQDLIQENVLNYNSELIAEQETLFSESLVRQEESLLVQQQTQKQVYKEWNSIFAETSRDTHMEASGQEKPTNELFMVRNPKTKIPEYGQHPKDESFSLNNKIHCLCFVVYYLL